MQESQTEQAPILELQKRLGISISSSKAQVNLVDEMEDKELHELSSRLAGETLPTRDQFACIQVFFFLTCGFFLSLFSFHFRIKFSVSSLIII